jgi:hypothetical protein
MASAARRWVVVGSPSPHTRLKSSWSSRKPVREARLGDARLHVADDDVEVEGVPAPAPEDPQRRLQPRRLVPVQEGGDRARRLLAGARDADQGRPAELAQQRELVEIEELVGEAVREAAVRRGHDRAVYEAGADGDDGGRGPPSPRSR